MLAVIAPVTRASAQAAAPPPPKAWILVDADTGAVISAWNEHEALPPASTTKVLTALVAERLLDSNADIPVSARAEGTPATKINMKAGQTWTLDDTLHALLMSSANDAAVALAERVAGSVEGFQADLDDEAGRLNMTDSPVLLDPAGLDDSFSVGGGNHISAHDLALAGRALLAEPKLAGIVAENIARFNGGDGIAHRLVNHNNMIRHYQGAIGMKTGWTVKAGHCLIAAAQRNGRTMLSVVMGAPDMYGYSGALLDQGFATPVRTEATMAHLPPVPTDKPAAKRPVQSAVPGAAALTTPAEATAAHSGRWGNLLINIIGALALAIALVRARVRVVRRRRRHARIGHVPTRPAPVRPPRVSRPPRQPRPSRPARRVHAATRRVHAATAARQPTPKPKPAAAPTPKPAPVALPVPASQIIWEGRTLEEWERPLVSR